jgi:hypothetical protein
VTIAVESIGSPARRPPPKAKGINVASFIPDGAIDRGDFAKSRRRWAAYSDP